MGDPYGFLSPEILLSSHIVYVPTFVYNQQYQINNKLESEKICKQNEFKLKISNVEKFNAKNFKSYFRGFCAQASAPFHALRDGGALAAAAAAG